MNTQDLPKPLIIGAIAVVAAVGIFFLIRAGSTPTVPGPKIEVGQQAVPEYLRDKLPPEVQAQIKQESERVGTVTERATQMGSQAPAAPNAAPNAAPTAAPSPAPQ